MAELSFKINVDSNGVASVSKLGKDFTNLDKVAKKSGNSINIFEKQFGSFANKFAGFAAAGFFLKLGKDAIMAQAGIESLELQFKPLLGSAEEAKKRIEELSEFAAKTPFELPEIAKASKVLETLTQGVLSTGKGLTLVGDAAAVAGVGFDELAIHVGRAFSNLKSNRATGESLSRLQELGLVSGDVRNKIEDLQKSAKGEEAWQILRSELEKSEGAMEGLSGTLSGKLSTLSDTWTMFTASVMNSSGSFSAVKWAVDELITSIEWWQDLIDDKPEPPYVDVVKSVSKLGEKLDEVAVKQALVDKWNKQAKDSGVELTEANKKGIAMQESMLINLKMEAKALEEKVKQSQGMAKIENDKIANEKQMAKDRQALIEKQKQEDLARDKREKQSIIDRANAIKLQQDAELKEMELFLKEIEKAENEKAKLATDRMNQQLDTEELLRQELHARKTDEFTLLREQEIADYELKKEIFIGFNDALRLAEEEHTAKMLDIKTKETESIKALEKQKQQAQLDTFNVQAMIAQNSIATMSILFGENKALSSAMVTIQGAQAVVNALTVQPFPLGLSMAVLAGAQTAKSLATIHNTKAFALGTGRIAGGEQMIRVNEQGEESVLNAPTTRALGRETIDLLNNGRADLLGKNSGGDTYNFNATGYISDDMLDQFEAMVASRRGNR